MKSRSLTVMLFLLTFYNVGLTYSQANKKTDIISPTIECVSISKGTTKHGVIEVFALDFLKSYTDLEGDNNKLLFTFNTENPVDTLINKIHYFIKGKSVSLKEYQDGLAQKWHPKHKTASKIFFNDAVEPISQLLIISCFDEALNSANCRVEFVTVSENEKAMKSKK